MAALHVTVTPPRDRLPPSHGKGPAQLYCSEFSRAVSVPLGRMRLRCDVMNSDAFLLLRFFFALCFFGTLFATYKVVQHSERLFGKDPDAPSENGSSRMYGKMQAIVVLAHALLLFGA